uniref:(northern house mosquito) hypothetical protein n=1 Tax=Culex pipiens TaxID=7175 RepID=A0A8D8MI66_CULPI
MFLPQLEDVVGQADGSSKTSLAKKKSMPNFWWIYLGTVRFWSGCSRQRGSLVGVDKVWCFEQARQLYLPELRNLSSSVLVVLVLEGRKLELLKYFSTPT